MRGTSSSSVHGAGDVGVEVTDGLLLLGDDAVDQVADGDDADDAAGLGDDVVAELAVVDVAQALADGVLAGDGDERAGHVLRDESLLGVTALEDDLAGVVALGDDAEQFAAFHHQQRAYALVGHHLNVFIDGGIGGDAEDVIGLLPEHCAYGRGHLAQWITYEQLRA
jgi:hypothetical protein